MKHLKFISRPAKADTDPWVIINVMNAAIDIFTVLAGLITSFLSYNGEVKGQNR